MGKKTKRKTSKASRKNSTVSNCEPVFNFALAKPVKGAVKVQNAPFTRINPNIIANVENHLLDNTYDGFLERSGNSYGKEASDKLIVVKGKDFRKEKTKFKNKTSFSSSLITKDVKSIKLDYDSE